MPKALAVIKTFIEMSKERLETLEMGIHDHSFNGQWPTGLDFDKILKDSTERGKELAVLGSLEELMKEAKGLYPGKKILTGLDCGSFTDVDWYGLAKAIDNDYTGNQPVVKLGTDGVYSLSTGKCDSAYLVRVYSDTDGITEVAVLGGGTEDWREVHDDTYTRIWEALDVQY